MASIVLSGFGPVTYTNNTGENVRVVINYLSSTFSFSGTSNPGYTMSWAGVNIIVGMVAIGRNLAAGYLSFSGASSQSAFGQNALPTQAFQFGIPTQSSAPTEIMLAQGQTFSTSNNSSVGQQFPFTTNTSTLGAYNIVVIPEAG